MCRSDLQMIDGYFQEFISLKFPFTPGHEIAVWVEEIGPTVPEGIIKKGDLVINNADAEKFLHVHPVKEVASDWHGGPEIAFRANLPSPGLYKAGGQFQHRGNVITVFFVLEVI